MKRVYLPPVWGTPSARRGGGIQGLESSELLLTDLGKSSKFEFAFERMRRYQAFQTVRFQGCLISIQPLQDRLINVARVERNVVFHAVTAEPCRQNPLGHEDLCSAFMGVHLDSKIGSPALRIAQSQRSDHALIRTLQSYVAALHIPINYGKDDFIVNSPLLAQGQRHEGGLFW